MDMTNFKKNDIFEAEVLDLTHEGQGVVKVDSYPFFVDNALPGERIKMRVLKVGKSFGFGRVDEFISQSEHRTTQLNLDYLRTGIADFGHLTYNEQVKFKQKQVVDILRKTAGKEDFPVSPVIESIKTIKYRNKAQIPVQMVNGILTTGFYRKNSHSLIPVEDFYIQHPEIDAVVLFLRDEFRKINLQAYDEKTRKGWLRNIVVRRGFHTSEMMVSLVVTSKKLPENVDLVIDKLVEHFTNIKSVQLNINTGTGSFILGKEFVLLYGKDFITDLMLDKTYQISAPAFYQVNTPQAEKLYETAFEFAELKPGDIVIDAYSGIGTIGISMADRVAEVYGMEVVPAAVENAKRNAQLNELENTHYEVGTAEKIMPKWLDEGIKPDVIFVDPPRKGLDETFIKSATATNPRRIVYISCNPATFARDVVRFENEGYILDKVQPVDLFPQTHHIELVARFNKK
ncbi:23S rRNA (uracil(1939)-C(5))-methyltransferase RlmD [Lactococcus cremoris]|uniref:RNA methyltransferase n=2 Tax=Lactococcus lactis subsp. cremoris TaxID=1359 RepID=A0A2A5SSC2_LACLC|nr:23S rRNA (uracil(1939)-C(5))-methyltransferase RlmD [Lactococcus cremoris]KGH34434.1 RNA methyltransferase [Lactococcus cremoris]PCS18005.1 RNA methyltransferase [Lactococcus cremoris subsp. tructae]QSE64534.1 23S rRNA (uracil(1939)-C(5))-methyltransferase RlmD [Lactococcus cremoris]WMX70230.1 23S rRNA (uracil(1939)-C(5))-methyltransferase RlmD [Lactococcus cremoris]